MLDGLFKNVIKKCIFELKFDKEKYPPMWKTVKPIADIGNSK